MVAEARQWLHGRRWLILFAMAYMASTVLLFNPFSLMSAIAGHLAPGADRVLFLVEHAHILGGLLLMITFTAGLTALPGRLARRVNWWKSQCPSCSQPALKRIRRTRLDRLAAVSGVPFRRYLCDNCQWTGLRIDNDRL
jgi:hypothetical protein